MNAFLVSYFLTESSSGNFARPYFTCTSDTKTFAANASCRNFKVLLSFPIEYQDMASEEIKANFSKMSVIVVTFMSCFLPIVSCQSTTTPNPYASFYQGFTFPSFQMPSTTPNPLSTASSSTNSLASSYPLPFTNPAQFNFSALSSQSQFSSSSSSSQSNNLNNLKDQWANPWLIPMPVSSSQTNSGYNPLASIFSSTTTTTTTPAPPMANFPFLTVSGSNLSPSSSGVVSKAPIDMYNLMAMQKGRAFPIHEEIEDYMGQNGSPGGPGGGMMGSQSMAMGMDQAYGGGQSPGGMGYGASNMYPQQFMPSSPYGGGFGGGSPQAMSGGGLFGQAFNPGVYGSPGMMGGMMQSASSPFGSGGAFSGGFQGGMMSSGSGMMPGMMGGGGMMPGMMPGMGGGFGGGGLMGGLGNMLSPILGGQTRLSFGGGFGGMGRK